MKGTPLGTLETLREILRLLAQEQTPCLSCAPRAFSGLGDGLGGLAHLAFRTPRRARRGHPLFGPTQLKFRVVWTPNGVFS